MYDTWVRGGWRLLSLTSVIHVNNYVLEGLESWRMSRGEKSEKIVE